MHSTDVRENAVLRTHGGILGKATFFLNVTGLYGYTIWDYSPKNLNNMIIFKLFFIIYSLELLHEK